MKKRDRIFEEDHAKIQQVLIKPGRVSVVSEIEGERPWFHRSSAGKVGRPRAEQTGKLSAHLGGNQQLHRTDLARKRLELSGKGKNRPGTKAADLFFRSTLQGGRCEADVSAKLLEQFGHDQKVVVEIKISDGGNGKKLSVNTGDSKIPRFVQAGRGKKKPVTGFVADFLGDPFAAVGRWGNHPHNLAAQVSIPLKGEGVFWNLVGTLVSGDENGDLPAEIGIGTLVLH
jgi:hypothetical protein